MSDTIRAAMRERFCAPEWSLFFEVANATGHAARRYADAVAMNLYPSRGLEVNGFEFKASRSDWLRELKAPAKAEDVYRYCDRWWLVVAKIDIVQMGELPATWGLMAMNGKGLRVATEAPKLQPEPLTRQFFAALARRATGAPEAEIRAMVDKRVEEARQRWQSSHSADLSHAREELRELKRKVHEFEQAAGLDIMRGWDPEHPQKLGAALRLFMDNGFDSIGDTLGRAEDGVGKLLAQIQATRAAMTTPPVGKDPVSPNLLVGKP